MPTIFFHINSRNSCNFSSRLHDICNYDNVTRNTYIFFYIVILWLVYHDKKWQSKNSIITLYIFYNNILLSSVAKNFNLRVNNYFRELNLIMNIVSIYCSKYNIFFFTCYQVFLIHWEKFSIMKLCGQHLM